MNGKLIGIMGAILALRRMTFKELFLLSLGLMLLAFAIISLTIGETMLEKIPTIFFLAIGGFFTYHSLKSVVASI